MKSLLTTLVLSFAALLLPAAEVPMSVVLDKDLAQTFATMPVQDSGRVKPLETVISYRLLRFHGKRSISITNPETNATQTLKPMQWMLLSWFRPDVACKTPLFVVDNNAALVEIGLNVEGRGKRDRWSYDEINAHRDELMKKMGAYQELDPKKRSTEQEMVVNLGVNFLDFEFLTNHWNFVSKPVKDPSAIPEELKAVYNVKPFRFSAALPAIAGYIKAHPEAAAPMANPFGGELFQTALSTLMSGNREQTLRPFPPAPSSDEQWSGPGSIFMDSMKGVADPAQLKWLAQYEEIYLALPDAAKVKEKAAALISSIQTAAKECGQGGYVGLELNYLHTDYFFHSLWLFLLGLIMLAVSWAAPQAKWSRRLVLATWIPLGIATLLSVAGITVRCLIMQRPPITVLYETIIFITAAIALFGLFMEAITRWGWGLIVTALCGTAGMFLSIRFETMEGQDTMQQLQAVLITNFWLATHVPIVNLGYAACAVAAVVSMIYLALRVINCISPTEQKNLTRIAYGFVCGGLFLSLVGTVLGGIWANYSWGRFWGWDPKENGALMICLMCLIILHARLGGYIRELGIHASNLVLGSIVAFSWFGVNQLGVGLHAYGFTSGVWFWLRLFWLSQLLLLGVALLIKFTQEKPTAMPPSEGAAKAV